MARWITNWPGGGAKWASCSAAFAAVVAAPGGQGGQVRLVKNTVKLSRHILRTPDFARPRALGRPISRAVVTAMRISPLDRHREQQQRRAA